MTSSVEWHGDEAMRVLTENFRKAIARSAGELQTTMKKTLSRPGRGRHHPGQPTTSSAPGDPPVAQTGTLRRTVQIDVSRLSKFIARRIFFAATIFIRYRARFVIFNV